MRFAFKNLKVRSKIGQQLITKLKAKHEWCFSNSKSNKICAAHPIRTQTAKHSRTNVFRGKQTTNNLTHLTYSEVSKCYVFSGDKLRNKMPLVYSECKLEKDRCGRCIFNLKCWKTIENNMFTEKQTTNKVAKTFFHVKAVTERKK